jgi:hypothetical protein
MNRFKIKQYFEMSIKGATLWAIDVAWHRDHPASIRTGNPVTERLRFARVAALSRQML